MGLDAQKHLVPEDKEMPKNDKTRWGKKQTRSRLEWCPLTKIAQLEYKNKKHMIITLD